MDNELVLMMQLCGFACHAVATRPGEAPQNEARARALVDFLQCFNTTMYQKVASAYLKTQESYSGVFWTDIAKAMQGRYFSQDFPDMSRSVGGSAWPHLSRPNNP
jgi:hypothetical protein